MRHALGLGTVLLALLAQAATAQTAAPPAAAPAVPLGDTAMVDHPCLPVPKPLLDWISGPIDAPLTPEAIKAYGPWNAWEQANDWPGLCRYRDANHEVMAGPRPSVVFMGDSITENWRRAEPGFFTGGRVGRGISGQTTPQMVARFYQDVVALKPRIVHIMAGTNNVAGNTGPTSEDAFKNDIAAMVDLSRANGITVILAAIPPADKFNWKPALKPAREIVKLNAWLAAYARQRGVVFVDYTPVLATPTGGMKPELSGDGVHPRKAGYDLMQPITLKAIAQAEQRAEHRAPPARPRA